MGIDKVPKHTANDKIMFNNQVLGFGRKRALEHNVRANIRNVLNPQAGVTTTGATATGRGLVNNTPTVTVILPSSDKQLKKDLSLIIAYIHAGNNYTEMKNKGLATIDELKNKGKIKPREETQLQKFFLATHK